LEIEYEDEKDEKHNHSDTPDFEDHVPMDDKDDHEEPKKEEKKQPDGKVLNAICEKCGKKEFRIALKDGVPDKCFCWGCDTLMDIAVA